MAEITKEEKAVLLEMAERCAGVSKGGKVGRWSHEDRVAVVYSVLCSMYNLSKKDEKQKVSKSLI